MKHEQLLIKYVWENESLKIPRQLSKERIARRRGWGLALADANSFE